jgi:hypothetical protein
MTVQGFLEGLTWALAGSLVRRCRLRYPSRIASRAPLERAEGPLHDAFVGVAGAGSAETSPVPPRSPWHLALLRAWRLGRLSAARASRHSRASASGNDGSPMSEGQQRPALGQKSFRSCDKRHRLTCVSGGNLCVRGGKTSLIGHRPVNLLLHLATHGGVLFYRKSSCCWRRVCLALP